MELLAELEGRHAVEDSPLDGLGVFHSLFFIEISPADLVRDCFRGSEICLGCRDDRLDRKCREFSQLDELGIEVRRDKRSLDLELEKTVIEYLCDVSCLLEKSHDISP